MATFAISRHCVPASAAPEKAVLQFSVDSVYFIIATFQALCTSAAPERALLQFSVDSVDSILH